MSGRWVIVHEIHDPLFDYVDRRYIDFCFQGYSGNFKLLFQQDRNLLIVLFSLVYSW